MKYLYIIILVVVCASSSWGGDVNVNQLGGTSLSGAQIVDVTNSALKVNVVAGGITNITADDVWNVGSLLLGLFTGIAFVLGVREK